MAQARKNAPVAAFEPRSRRQRALRKLRRLRRIKPSRRHVHTALMATVPTAALFGFAGPKAHPTSEIAITAPMKPNLSESEPVETVERPAETQPAAVNASYYGEGFAGKKTASGEVFNPRQLTAAHRTLPFGSLVKVTDAITGKNVIVRINDRGPFHGNRDIDLSHAAAERLGMIGAGTGKVILKVLGSR